MPDIQHEIKSCFYSGLVIISTKLFNFINITLANNSGLYGH